MSANERPNGAKKNGPFFDHGDRVIVKGKWRGVVVHDNRVTPTVQVLVELAKKGRHMKLVVRRQEMSHA